MLQCNSDQNKKLYYKFTLLLFLVQEEYDLLLEDEVEFVRAIRIPGEDEKKEKTETKPVERKLTTIEETQRSLPIYPFKKDLIQAIRDHQVMNHSFNLKQALS